MMSFETPSLDSQTSKALTTMTFEALNLEPQICKALAACNYTKPTPIQAKSIPGVLLGRDMVASAPTGTGKTGAFLLPALNLLLTTKKTEYHARVLVLTPTRELATQITSAVEKYSKFLRCNIASLVGGMPYRQQLRSLSRPIDIIVATPGRLLDHLSKGRLDLSAIEMLVLDEADRMLDMGFIEDVKTIAAATPKSRQTLLFSATVDSKLTQIIRQLLKDPIRVDFAAEKLTPAKIAQELYMADSPHHKMRLLMHFIEEKSIFKAIIFSGTKINADRLANEISAKGYAAAPLHGDLKQNVRSRTVEQLRKGKIQFLIATDVAARGIDIPDVTHVINFDLPKFSEDYVHRIGRTGRAGRAGTAISLALHQDKLHIERIERLMKQQLIRKVIEGMEPTVKPQRQSDSSAPNKRGSGKYAKKGAQSNRFERPYKSKLADGDNRRSSSFSKPRSPEGNRRSPHSKSRPTDTHARPYSKSKSADSDRRPYAAKSRSVDGDRRSYAAKPSRSADGDRRSYADKPRSADGDRRSYAAKPRSASNSDRPFAKFKSADSHSRPYTTKARSADSKPLSRRSKNQFSKTNSNLEILSLKKKKPGSDKPFKKTRRED